MMNFVLILKMITHANKIKKIMENAIEFKVPSVVDKGLGESWGDAK